MAEDPICGMVVDPEKAEFKTEKDGQTYYFCSESCKHTFGETSTNHTKKKGFFTRFLEWIAKANTAKFGDKPPSCCGNGE